MNLGTINYKPVVIDSNHFKTENKPKLSSEQMANVTAKFKTTNKFSKI